MTSNAPLPASSDAGTQRNTTGKQNRPTVHATLNRNGADAKPAQARVAAIPSNKSNIEYLLHSMALRQRNASSKTNPVSSLRRDPETVVALDAIASWIGRTEKRLAGLSSLKPVNPTAFVEALVVVSNHVQALYHKISVLPEASACTVAAITDMSLEIERLQSSLAQRASHEELSTLNESIQRNETLVSRISHALTIIERRLSIIEQQTSKRDDGPLAHQLSMLVQHLDKQTRSTAGNTTSSIRCFELMAEKIEDFSRDIRRFRKERADTAAIGRLLLALLEKIGQQPEYGRNKDNADENLTAVEALPEKIDLITTQLNQLQTEIEMLQKEKSILSSEMKLLKNILEQKTSCPEKQASSFPSVTDQLNAAARSFEKSDQIDQSAASPKGDFIPDDAERPEFVANQTSDVSADPTGLRMRADFIAAARRATHPNIVSDDVDSAARQTEAAKPVTPRRFLRMSATNEL